MKQHSAVLIAIAIIVLLIVVGLLIWWAIGSSQGLSSLSLSSPASGCIPTAIIYNRTNARVDYKICAAADPSCSFPLRGGSIGPWYYSTISPDLTCTSLVFAVTAFDPSSTDPSQNINIVKSFDLDGGALFIKGTYPNLSLSYVQG